MTDITYETILKEKPLIAFSVYTHGQAEFLVLLGDEILTVM